MEFLKSMLSNDNGVVSSNRVCLVVIVIALVAWSSYSVISTGSIPDVSESWIYLIGIFVGGTSIGKATDAITTIKAPVVDDYENK